MTSRLVLVCERESIARWLAIAMLRLLFAELCSAATRSDKPIFEMASGKKVGNQLSLTARQVLIVIRMSRNLFAARLLPFWPIMPTTAVVLK